MVKAFEVLFYPEENLSQPDWGGNYFISSNFVPQNHHGYLLKQVMVFIQVFHLDSAMLTLLMVKLYTLISSATLCPFPKA